MAVETNGQTMVKVRGWGNRLVIQWTAGSEFHFILVSMAATRFYCNPKAGLGVIFPICYCSKLLTTSRLDTKFSYDKKGITWAARSVMMRLMSCCGKTSASSSSFARYSGDGEERTTVGCAAGFVATGALRINVVDMDRDEVGIDQTRWRRHVKQRCRRYKPNASRGRLDIGAKSWLSSIFY